MSVNWDGPFAHVATAGQRITGWSENTTGAATLKNVAGTGRYLDGNPLSAFAGTEIAGNVNYHVATSRRVIWQQDFCGSGTADEDGARTANTGTSWATHAAWYAIKPRCILVPSPRRGASPPRLSVRIDAKMSAATGGLDGTVRVYTFATFNEATRGFPAAATHALAETYAAFTIVDTTYKATPGWFDAATITKPAVSVERIAHPGVATLPDTECWVTYLVLAAVGNGAGEGPIVSAVQVIEEARGA